MNKKGFIATSLLYSFFLLFCAIILSFVGNLGHNTVLLNKEIDKINEDIHTTKYIYNVKVGDYFRLNICVAEDKKDLFNSGDTIDYVLFSKNNGLGYFVSKNYSYKLNNLELLNNIIDSIYVRNNDKIISSRSMTENDYNIIESITDTKLKDTIIKGDFNNTSRYLLANNSDNNYSGSKVYDMSSNTVRDINNDDITSDNTFIRLVFEFNNSLKIIGGDGTLSNPYLLEGGAVSC